MHQDHLTLKFTQIFFLAVCFTSLISICQEEKKIRVKTGENESDILIFPFTSKIDECPFIRTEYRSLIIEIDNLQSEKLLLKKKPVNFRNLQTESLPKKNELLGNLAKQFTQQEDIPSLDELPSPQKISNTQFSGIILYHQVPLIFVEGEIFHFTGKVIRDMSPDPMPVVHVGFGGIGSSKDKSFSCAHYLKDQQKQFSISCPIRSSGRFLITVFSGKTGSYSKMMRFVEKPRDPDIIDKTPTFPSPIYLLVEENQLIVRWKSLSALTRLKFTQIKSGLKMKIKQFLLSNYHQQFEVPFEQFQDFQEGETYLEISHASSFNGGFAERDSKFSLPVLKEFSALKHKFALIRPEAQNLVPIPWKVPVNSYISILGSFPVDVDNTLFLVQPTSHIITMPLIKNTNIIKALTIVNKTFALRKPGTYILQINYIAGDALINRPVYVGDGYPLLPDYQDLKKLPSEMKTMPVEIMQMEQMSKESIVEPSRTASLKQKRSYLLKLLNNLRKMYEVQAVEIDPSLNSLAQDHVQDMIKNDYFSHENIDGLDAFQRAQESGFQGSIGENLASSRNLTDAHLSLERSPAHLKNSVNSRWTRVGIGIAIHPQNGMYMVAFSFSTRDIKQNPLTTLELYLLQKELMEVMLEKTKNIIKSEQKKLSVDIKSWQSSKQNRKTRLLEYLRDQGHLKAMKMVGESISYDPSIVQLFRERSTTFKQAEPKFNQVGLSVGMLDGVLEILVVFI